MMTQARLKELLAQFPKIRIAVVGDFFLDKWLTIDRRLDEVSIETGLTAYQVVKKRIFAGAAGTVLANLSALEVGTLYGVGFVGEDGEGYELLRDLKDKKVNIEHIAISSLVMTPTYTKPMFLENGIETETNRLDFKNVERTPEALEDEVIRNIWEVAPKVDAVIALDQLDDENRGVVTQRVREELAKLNESYPNLIVYADSRSFTNKFRNVIIKCNDIEAVRAIRPELQGKQSLAVVKECFLEYSKQTGKRVFVTCGEKGVLTKQGEDAVLVGTVKQTGEIDIVGAGDACTSGIVSSLCCGATNEEAAFIGNLTSSITIQVIGTTGTATRAQLEKRYDEYYGEKR